MSSVARVVLHNTKDLRLFRPKTKPLAYKASEPESSPVHSPTEPSHAPVVDMPSAENAETQQSPGFVLTPDGIPTYVAPSISLPSSSLLNPGGSAILTRRAEKRPDLQSSHSTASVETRGRTSQRSNHRPSSVRRPRPPLHSHTTSEVSKRQESIFMTPPEREPGSGVERSYFRTFNRQDSARVTFQDRATIVAPSPESQYPIRPRVGTDELGYERRPANDAPPVPPVTPSETLLSRGRRKLLARLSRSSLAESTVESPTISAARDGLESKSSVSALSSYFTRRREQSSSSTAPALNFAPPTPDSETPLPTAGPPLLSSVPPTPTPWISRSERTTKSSPSISPLTVPQPGWLDIPVRRNPVPETLESYIAKDGQKYTRPDFHSPRQASFLPSEMRRVNTPPVIKSRSNHHRGFFFDIRNAPKEPDLQSPDGSLGQFDRRGSVLGRLPAKSSSIWSRKWNRSSQNVASPAEDEEHLSPVPPPVSPVFRQRFDQYSIVDDEDEDNESEFQLDVPDHLPSSPLCPLNPKYRGGVKAICPLHGRGKPTKRLTDDLRAVL